MFYLIYFSHDLQVPRKWLYVRALLNDEWMDEWLWGPALELLLCPSTDTLFLIQTRALMGNQSKELSFHMEIYQNVFRKANSKNKQITGVQPCWVYLPVQC